MKELVGVLIAVALLLGATWLFVEQLGDRETVVPPPDAVAEQFARAVMAKRWEPAKSYLAEPESRSTEELEQLQRELGQRENVEADTVSRDERRAVVAVRVPNTAAVVNVALTFDGEWKVE